MKRITLLFLTILMLFPLASCGKEEYKYSALSDIEIIKRPRDDTNKPITNGAMVALQKHSIFGQEVDENSKNPFLLCIFDEETKVMFPLCFDTACRHESSLDCFACGLSSSISYTTIVSDQVITAYYGGQSRTQKTIIAKYYSLDGTVQKEIKYDLTELKTPDGSGSDNYLESFMLTCRYENKVYFPVFNYDSGAGLDYELSNGNPDKTYYCWIMCFDTANAEIYPVSGFEVPHPYDIYIKFLECEEDKLSFSYAKAYYYVTDLTTGLTEEVDLSAIALQLYSQGNISLSEDLSTFLPIKGILAVPRRNPDQTISYYDYFDTNTLEKLELSEPEKMDITDRTLQTFTHEGEKYYLIGTDSETNSYKLINSSDKTVSTGSLLLSENRHGEKGSYNPGIIAESEKGFICRLGYEGWSDRVTRNVNGTEVTYLVPAEYVYISKEDILDGGEVTPLYYNPETGTFAQ